jgi:hypothetical protein
MPSGESTLRLAALQIHLTALLSCATHPIWQEISDPCVPGKTMDKIKEMQDAVQSILLLIESNRF